MSAKSWFKFILLGCIWGSSFLWIKIALQEVGPLTLVTFRTGFAALGLIVVALVMKPKMRRSDVWILAVLGLFNVAIPFALISWSETHISSGMASILNSTVPLFTILIAPLFLQEERLTFQRIFGLLMGFAGVIVLMSNKVDLEDSFEKVGVVTMLVAACFYAGSGIFARKMNRGMKPAAQSLGQMGSAFLFITPFALTFEAPFHFPTLPISYVGLIWLGLLGSCVATLLWFSLLNTIGPTRTSMTTYIFPLVGVLLGMIFLGEHVDWHLIVGGVLIILAVFIVNTQKNPFARKEIQPLVEDLEQEND
ncbi:MAG: DMT family transporter [Anaerolineaceae bacterium]